LSGRDSQQQKKRKTPQPPQWQTEWVSNISDENDGVEILVGLHYKYPWGKKLHDIKVVKFFDTEEQATIWIKENKVKNNNNKQSNCKKKKQDQPSTRSAKSYTTIENKENKGK